ncbi:acyl-CoA thioesterase [Acinetobacter sp. ANC 3813]|uniref:acyl-CoA thioesterase n=1 Tax=Acinetobacter sp. ANC 3813 TaxID=1977873 RepID=UPI000A34D505|nr:acyl-CoA thioesterase [Acinetobacter sp. ANC 3813]OTG90936.1 acyl-CoA thioesterase [Acinetobacter sp. ANC 3813]
MKRPYRRKAISASVWTTEQDIFLIENSSRNLSELSAQLPYTEEQIAERKELLGLIRREWQMRQKF